MSKRTIHFSYNNLSPRSVSETQKGPIKIGNLIDTINNPQFEEIQLPPKEKIQPLGNKVLQKEIKLKDDTNLLENISIQPQKIPQNEIKVENTSINLRQNSQKQTKPNQIRLRQFPAVIQEPTDADFQLNLVTPKKVPNNVNNTKQRVGDQIESQLQTNPKKAQQVLPISSQKPKFTFAIIPPPPEEKRSIFCNLFGWCDKPKQRTYPIQD